MLPRSYSWVPFERRLSGLSTALAQGYGAKSLKPPRRTFCALLNSSGYS
jgi:hypothetical protein